MFKRINSSVMLALVFVSMFMLSVGVVAAQGVRFQELTAAMLPWDAVPSPDGSVVYFTAIGSDGTPGVFSVPSAGGEASVVKAGRPLVMPLGIAISTDGQMLYVSDPWTAGSDGSAVYALAISTGEATVVEGTQGTAPQGVEVMSRDGADWIYFTGMDVGDGQPAVYRVAAAGGDVTQIAKGAPLVAPSGVALAQDGTVYVLDRLASGNGMGAVLRIQGNTVDIIARDVRTGGQLAGIALTLDESLLLASSLDTEAGTAQVLVINLATMETSIINEVINQSITAGGLHRAHDVNMFAWADVQRPGRIYRVDP